MLRAVPTRLACGAVLGLCTVWLAGVPPAQARDRNGRVVVEVSGRRRGEDRDRECRYDVRRGDAEFDDRG